MHVLIATDGSDQSISAATRGRTLLAAADDVTLLNVMTDGDPDDDAGGMEGPVLNEDEQEAERKRQISEAHDHLARTAATMTDGHVEQLVESGDAANVICAVADRLGVDAIVIGSHGRTGIGRLLLGSVSEHVVRHAPCPVLVVRNQHA